VPSTRRALKPHATDGRRVDRSDWTRIWVLVLAVVVSAMQIGKVPPALSLLREDLSMGLVASAWILSMFSALGASFGSVAGAFADRYGSRRVRVASLLIAIAVALAGSPPILAALGWRPLWELNAALSAGLALAVAWSHSRAHTVSARHSTQFGAMLRASLLRPGTLLLAAVAFSAIGGLVPASIFTAVPNAAPAEARSTTMGIVVQATHIGQLVGPATVAAVAAAVGGWHASALVLLPVAAVGLSASSCQRTSSGVSCRPNIRFDWRPCCQAAAVRISWQRGNDTDVRAEVPVWHNGEALASVTSEV
jgi:MFS family permease